MTRAFKFTQLKYHGTMTRKPAIAVVTSCAEKTHQRFTCTSNGEVEGPRSSADRAPRVHTVFPHPRRGHAGASRTPPTIVRAHVLLPVFLKHLLQNTSLSAAPFLQFLRERRILC